MNEVIQAILKRRSYRAFTEEAVSREDLETLLQCALSAPSGMGKQTWKFTAITDRAKIQRLCQAVTKKLDRGPSYDMYNPAVLIITSNEKTSPWCREDNACAMENLYLASEALGLGCVWINQLLTIFDEPEIRALLDEFHIPADHGVYGCAAIGHPVAVQIKEKQLKGKAEIID